MLVHSDCPDQIVQNLLINMQAFVVQYLPKGTFSHGTAQMKT